MINKNFYRKTNDKKILHKVGKQWKVVSVALLMAIGGGAAVATHANAQSNNNVNASTSAEVTALEQKPAVPSAVSSAPSSVAKSASAKPASSVSYQNGYNGSAASYHAQALSDASVYGLNMKTVNKYVNSLNAKFPSATSSLNSTYNSDAAKTSADQTAAASYSAIANNSGYSSEVSSLASKAGMTYSGYVQSVGYEVSSFNDAVSNGSALNEQMSTVNSDAQLIYNIDHNDALSYEYSAKDVSANANATVMAAYASNAARNNAAVNSASAANVSAYISAITGSIANSTAEEIALTESGVDHDFVQSVANNVAGHSYADSTATSSAVRVLASSYARTLNNGSLNYLSLFANTQFSTASFATLSEANSYASATSNAAPYSLNGSYVVGEFSNAYGNNIYSAARSAIGSSLAINNVNYNISDVAGLDEVVINTAVMDNYDANRAAFNSEISTYSHNKASYTAAVSSASAALVSADNNAASAASNAAVLNILGNHPTYANLFFNSAANTNVSGAGYYDQSLTGTAATTSAANTNYGSFVNALANSVAVANPSAANALLSDASLINLTTAGSNSSSGQAISFASTETKSDIASAFSNDARVIGNMLATNGSSASAQGSSVVSNNYTATTELGTGSLASMSNASDSSVAVNLITLLSANNVNLSATGSKPTYGQVQTELMNAQEAYNDLANAVAGDNTDVNYVQPGEDIQNYNDFVTAAVNALPSNLSSVDKNAINNLLGYNGASKNYPNTLRVTNKTTIVKSLNKISNDLGQLIAANVTLKGDNSTFTNTNVKQDLNNTRINDVGQIVNDLGLGTKDDKFETSFSGSNNDAYLRMCDGQQLVNDMINAVNDTFTGTYGNSDASDDYVANNGKGLLNAKDYQSAYADLNGAALLNDAMPTSADASAVNSMATSDANSFASVESASSTYGKETDANVTLAGSYANSYSADVSVDENNQSAAKNSLDTFYAEHADTKFANAQSAALNAASDEPNAAALAHANGVHVFNYAPKYVTVTKAGLLHDDTEYAKGTALAKVPVGAQLAVQGVGFANDGTTRYAVNYDGKKGYFTANSEYVTPTYLAAANGVSVTLTKNANVYKDASFKHATGKTLPAGTKLPNVNIVSEDGIYLGFTRVETPSGNFITSNTKYAELTNDNADNSYAINDTNENINANTNNGSNQGANNGVGFWK